MKSKTDEFFSRIPMTTNSDEGQPNKHRTNLFTANADYWVYCLLILRVLEHWSLESHSTFYSTSTTASMLASCLEYEYCRIWHHESRVTSNRDSRLDSMLQNRMQAHARPHLFFDHVTAVSHCWAGHRWRLWAGVGNCIDTGQSWSPCGSR